MKPPKKVSTCWQCGWCEFGSRRSYLIPELLGEVGGLVQRETRHQRRGEDVRAAQLVDHVGHVEVRIILQQLSDTQQRKKENIAFN